MVGRLRNEEDADLFADCAAICQYLKTPELAHELFVRYHNESPEFAMKVAHSVKWQLFEGGHWELCSHYLPDVEAEYRKVRFIYDEPLERNRKSQRRFPPEKLIMSAFMRDVYRILVVLKNVGRDSEAREIMETVSADLASRGYPDFYTELLDCVEEERVFPLTDGRDA